LGPRGVRGRLRARGGRLRARAAAHPPGGGSCSDRSRAPPTPRSPPPPAPRDAVERWMTPYPALGRMDRATARHGWRIVMITRLVPIFPFNLQNYAYGLTSISFGAYLLTSFVCMLPATVAYTVAAGAVVAGAWDVRRMVLLLAGAGVLLVALSLLPRWLRGRSAALDDLLRTG